MVDQTIFTSDPLHRPIDIQTLKRIDRTVSKKQGVSLFLTFLLELKAQLDQGKSEIRLNLPFLQGVDEKPTLNEYYLYLDPRLAQPTESKRIIRLADVIHVLDELLQWADQIAFRDHPDVRAAVSAIGHSILDRQATITEAWLSDPAQQDSFKVQVQYLLDLFLKLSEEETPAAISLDELLKIIAQANQSTLLQIWTTPPPELPAIKDLLIAFNEMPLGELFLVTIPNIPAHQVRVVANEYFDRLEKEAQRTWPQGAPSNIKFFVDQLISKALTFDTSNQLAVKTTIEEEVIATLIAGGDLLIPALQNNQASKQSFGPARTSQAAGQQKQPQSSDTNTGVVPPQIIEDLTTNPFYDTSKRYYATSIHAGFLYNHVLSNVFTLYGLPFDLARNQLLLPPLLEYQLRQDILKRLYALDPTQLSSLNRLELGERLFRELILANPKLFISVERFLQTKSQEFNLQLKEVDPLHLEDRTQGFRNDEFIKSIEQQTDQLDERSEDTFQQLNQAVTQSVFNLNLAESDSTFIAGLQALGLELAQAEDTRRLILTYIQTTGLDLQDLLSNKELWEIQALFAGVNIDPLKLEEFRLLLLSYSQFQLQKLQQITNHRLIPNPRIAGLAAAGHLSTTSDDMVEIIRVARETATSLHAEGRDPRLYILASLSSSQELDPTSPQYRILASSLKEWCEKQELSVDETIQTIARINAFQRSELEKEVAQLSHQKIRAFHASIQSASASETDPAKTSPTSDLLLPAGLAAYSALSLKDRQNFVKQLLELDPTLSPQDIYAHSEGYWDSDVANKTYLPSESDPDALPDIQEQDTVQGGPISAISSLKQRYDNLRAKPEQIKKGISRIKTLGRTASQAKEAGAAALPKGSLRSRIIGSVAKALLGEKLGSKVQTAIQTGTFTTMLLGGVSSLISFIFSSLPLILAGIGVAGVVGFVKNALFGAPDPNVITAEQALASQANGQLPPPPETATPAATATTSTVASAPFSTATVATATVVGGTAVLGTVVMLTTHNAFLTALPTVGEQFISPYVEIEKVAVQGNAFDSPTDITYELRIRARQGYQIKLTQAPTDTFSVTFTQRAGEPPRPATSTVPASPEYDAFQAGLTTFHTDHPVITNEYVPIGRYTIPFGSNPGSVDYTDANVSNIFRISFTVLDENGQPVPEQLDETIASTGEVICFGECPQAQGGCWPMSGTIGQEPYGSYTHAVSNLEQDAYDIMAPIGTPVYAPFVGRACQGHIDPRYGYHVTMEVPNMSYNQQPGTVYLIFAHLDSVSPELNAGCFDVTSEMLRGGGFELGRSGNTGNSSGPHLHYEARWNTLDVSGKSHPSLIEQLVPTKAVYPDPVRSCYDQ